MFWCWPRAHGCSVSRQWNKIWLAEKVMWYKYMWLESRWKSGKVLKAYGISYEISYNLWFSRGCPRSPLLDPRINTHSSDVLFMVWKCAYVMCFGHYRQIIFSHFLWSCDPISGWYLHFRLQTLFPEIGPESGALATIGEFILIVTMAWRHLHF